MDKKDSEDETLLVRGFRCLGDKGKDRVMGLVFSQLLNQYPIDEVFDSKDDQESELKDMTVAERLYRLFPDTHLFQIVYDNVSHFAEVTFGSEIFDVLFSSSSPEQDEQYAKQMVDEYLEECQEKSIPLSYEFGGTYEEMEKDLINEAKRILVEWRWSIISQIEIRFQQATLD